jgi:hypothetical protein
MGESRKGGKTKVASNEQGSRIQPVSIKFAILIQLVIRESRKVEKSISGMCSNRKKKESRIIKWMKVRDRVGMSALAVNSAQQSAARATRYTPASSGKGHTMIVPLERQEITAQPPHCSRLRRISNQSIDPSSSKLLHRPFIDASKIFFHP